MRFSSSSEAELRPGPKNSGVVFSARGKSEYLEYLPKACRIFLDQLERLALGIGHRRDSAHLPFFCPYQGNYLDFQILFHVMLFAQHSVDVI
jgi:hypothetical protein